jgi:hypothetical protein
LARVRNLQNTDILWRCKKNPHLDANYFPKRFQFVTPTDKREGVFSDNIQMILIKTKIHEDDLRSERGFPPLNDGAATRYAMRARVASLLSGDRATAK